MIDNIERIRDEARVQITAAPSPEELERLRVHYLGKKGLLTNLLHSLKDLDQGKKKELGAVLNQIKTDFEALLFRREEELKRVTIDREIAQTEPIDVTLSGQYAIQPGSLHPVTRVMQDMVKIMRGIGFSVVTGPEIELEKYNFDALNMPSDHPARDMQDTFYIDPPVLLRTHTSPMQIRSMKVKGPPIQIVSVGKVYRSDYDATHTPMFHQMEGLMIGRDISFADLKGVLGYLVRNIFGVKPLRFRPSYFPFTEPSAEVDMQWGSGSSASWLEIGGCGMVHPNVLKAAGYNPDEVCGFAFGMGIERISMLRYGINDLRAFFENDSRMLEQF